MDCSYLMEWWENRCSRIHHRIYIAHYETACFGCCPPVLEQKWIEELQQRFGRRSYSVKAEEDFMTMVDENSISENSQPNVYVLPYSTARSRTLSPDLKFGTVVFDEIHHARNEETALYTRLHKLAKQSTYKVGLSATPIHNHFRPLNNLRHIISQIFSKGVELCNQ